MIRFIIAAVIVLIAFLCFFNVERIMPHLADDSGVSVPDTIPTEETEEEDTEIDEDADEDPIDDDETDIIGDDVLMDADGNVFSYLPAGCLLYTSPSPRDS